MVSDAEDLSQFLPYLLTQAAETTGGGFARIYKDRYGMLRSEWRVLFHLGQGGALSAGEICARSGEHKTKVSRAVAKLAARRFLTRSQNVDDRRSVRLALTAAGRAAYEDLSAKARAYDRELAALFSEDERAVLRRCLRRLAARDA